MKKILQKLKGKLPTLEGFSLSWLPSLNFSLFKNNIRCFEKLLDKEKWQKEWVGNDEIWVCENNNTFQICLSDKYRDFRKDWTDVYPNKSATFQPVQLKINNTVIKEISFIYCDETRIFVPLPKRIMEDNSRSYNYEWRRNSLAFKLAKIIGKYHIYKNIEGVAKISNIKIV